MTPRFLRFGCAAVAGVLLSLAPVAARQGPESLATTTAFEVNGLKVLVKRRVGSQTVSGGLFIRGGSQNITAKNAGVEGLMLDVATEASANFPRAAFRREIAATGTIVGAGITYDYSAFTLGCTRRYFDRAWTLFTDAVLHPSFAPEDLERVRNRELVGIASEDDSPDAFLQNLQSKVIYAGHPYANDPHGTVESLRSLTVADMKKFHDDMLHTSRLLLVLVGDVDPQEIKQKVTASFGALTPGNYTPSIAPPLSFAEPTLNVTAKALPTNYVQGVYAAPPLNSPDIYAMNIANSILRDRIFTEVRLKRALSYAPDASLGSQGANTGNIYVTAVDVNQTVRIMMGEIADLQRTDVSPDDISAAAQQFLTNYYMGQQTNAAQAGSLAEAEILGGGWRTSGDLIDRLRAVTPLDVRRVAARYIRNLQFTVLGSTQDIDKRIFLQPLGGGSPDVSGWFAAPGIR